MPNPVPLATKEEEERRAWVTAHHEVVRLVKDCFGDRFSNNEIFDRLKISRRTGYRALGNDERIGKAPGRKPKIAEETIKQMIEYIEQGGCSDVGNVWKHLAEKFAPDCNPKTVQDAVKKSGFKNYQNQVKLDPLLNQQVPENQPAPNEEAEQHAQYALQQAASQSQSSGSIQQTQQVPQQVPQQVQQDQQSMIDPAFHHAASAPEDVLRNAIATAPPDHVRMVLQDISSRFAEASQIASAYLCPFASHYPSVPVPVSHMGGSQMHHNLHVSSPHSTPHDHKRRLAICRRCGQQYDRAENTMEKRECLYHKGSPQKISPDDVGAIEQSPEAYIWSCCGGNGMVRGCCRAMHTTKKKRKYSKKRDATSAGLDDDDNTLHPNGRGGTVMDSDDEHDESQHGGAHYLDVVGGSGSLGVHDANIDASLQDHLHPSAAHLALVSLNEQLHHHQQQHHQTHSQRQHQPTNQTQAHPGAPPGAMAHAHPHQHHSSHHAGPQQAQHLQEAARHLQQAAMQTADAYARAQQDANGVVAANGGASMEAQLHAGLQQAGMLDGVAAAELQAGLQQMHAPHQQGGGGP